MSLRTLPTRSAAALVAVGDPSRDRTVYATIVLLVALGFTMIMLAVWLLRNTRPDPDVLAPLERMGQRKWRRADPVWQRRHLDEVRPGGADPLEPMSAPPAHDAEFERGPQPIGFDDLVASSTTTVAAGSELPAPAPGAAVEGPAEVDAGDAPAADDEAVASEADGDQTDEGATDDAAPDGEASGAADDEQDDEDITGEQDTDDFLAVLDTERDVDEDGGPDVETESGDAPAADDEAVTSEADGDQTDEGATDDAAPDGEASGAADDEQDDED
ncbi:MAG TPA: hypothetical protein VNO51_12425, partial [Ilumatobacteraceae bacterium]|nr:hypothetical protein [Ilumatobacteraceae bacterium]